MTKGPGCDALNYLAETFLQVSWKKQPIHTPFLSNCLGHERQLQREKLSVVKLQFRVSVRYSEGEGWVGNYPYCPHTGKFEQELMAYNGHNHQQP